MQRRAWEAPTLTPSPLPVILLRRLDEYGTLRLCAQALRLSAAWAGRLVRCEINPHEQRVAIYALRRGDPTHQPLIARRSLKTRLVPWHQPPT
jgi:hypothetical protein